MNPIKALVILLGQFIAYCTVRQKTCRTCGQRFAGTFAMPKGATEMKKFPEGELPDRLCSLSPGRNLIVKDRGSVAFKRCTYGVSHGRT